MQPPRWTKAPEILRCAAFSKAHHMVDYWQFLAGTRDELAPVWTKYAVDAQSAAATVSMHTAILYVIDKQGRERALLDQHFTTAQMAVALSIHPFSIFITTPEYPQNAPR